MRARYAALGMVSATSPSEYQVPSQQLLTSCRMLPHQRPLFFCELPSLVEHLRRHDQLADIVQQRASA